MKNKSAIFFYFFPLIGSLLVMCLFLYGLQIREMPFTIQEDTASEEGKVIRVMVVILAGAASMMLWYMNVSKWQNDKIQALQEALPKINADTINKARYTREIGLLVKQHNSPAKIRMADLAESLHVSERTLSRKVKEESKVSVMELVREIYLQEAYQRLAQKDSVTVSAIAYDLGFEDPAYFAKLFRRRFEKSPSTLLRG